MLRFFVFSLMIGLPLFAEHSEILKQAIVDVENGQIDSADSQLTNLWDQDSRNADVAFYRGRIAMAREAFEPAYSWFEKAIGIADTSARYQYWAGNASGLQAMRANVFSRIGWAKKARNHYENAVSIDPEFLDARWGLLQFYTMAPGIIGGSDDKAREEIEALCRLDSVQGIQAQGYFFQRKKKTREAIELYQRAIKDFPHEISFYLSLYQLFMQEEDYENALELTKQFTADHPDNDDGLLYQVYVYQAMGDFDHAWSVLDTLISVNPENMQAVYQVGRTAVLSNCRAEDGIKALQKYLKYQPQQGEPQPQHAYYRLGQIYENIDEIEAARNAYQHAVELDPDYEEAEKALKTL